jgi:hypothetical protein
MADLKIKKGSMIHQGGQIDYLIQTDGKDYIDLQVRRARYNTFEKNYDHYFIFSDGGEGIKACDEKIPGLRVLLKRRHPEINLGNETPLLDENAK